LDATTRTCADNVRAALEKIEASGNALHIDSAAFLVGLFGDTRWARNFTEKCPRIAALLPEMVPCTVRPMRMLTIAGWIDRDDDVGYLADQLRKWNP
jgi:hypothetical protein